MTIPSALAMIIVMFPEPAEQSTALAIFGALGALGGSLGFLIVSVHWFGLRIANHGTNDVI